ncbi:MAG: PEP-CTERM sorting domain-containing protein [Okeania sp. SIO3H1]|nr:PEP-CTERM sorting domain-containing protein [Okeania sp. SIO3H1]
MINKTFSTLIGSSVLAAGLAATSTVLSPSAAQAFSLFLGDTTDIYDDNGNLLGSGGSQSSNPVKQGASSFIDFDFTQLGNDVLLKLNITNTTGQPMDPLGNTLTPFGLESTTSKFTGFTFDILDGLSVNTGSFAAGTAFDYISTNNNFSPFSNSVGNFDVAIADNDNFEGGPANNALAEGEFDMVSFLLTGTGLVASNVEADFLSGFQDGSLNFATRYQQTINGGSEKLLAEAAPGGTTGGGTTGGGTTGGGTTGGGTTGGGTTGGGTTGGGTTGGGTTGGGTTGGGTTGGGTTGGGTTGGGTTGGGTTGGGTTGGGTTGSESIPEPGTILGLAVFFGGLLTSRRRKSN